MLDALFSLFDAWNAFFWGYIAFVLIMVFGILLTLQTKFFQMRHFLHLFRRFSKKRGSHPLCAFFASYGTVGITNVVGVITAVQMGGPGALLWIWVTGFIGAIIKYCDIYLGFKYRVPSTTSGYSGGPMYVMRAAYHNRWTALLVALLLSIYSTDIYQFSVLTDNLSLNWHLDRAFVIVCLIGMVLYAGLKGTKIIDTLSRYTSPLFFSLYLLLGFWVVGVEYASLPSLLFTVLKSAFTGHAAVGGFAGSSVMLAVQHGIARAVYSADIGSGFDSFVHSEAAPLPPHKHALLGILGVFVDNIICTISILIVLFSGAWTLGSDLEGSQLMQIALSHYVPFTEYIVPFLFFITGCISIMSYFVIGSSCAHYLSPRWGKKTYLLCASLSFIVCSFVSQNQTLLIMSTAGSIVFIINVLGVFKLRKEVAFDLHILSALRTPSPSRLHIKTRVHAHPPPARPRPLYALHTSSQEPQPGPLFPDFSPSYETPLQAKRTNQQ